MTENPEDPPKTLEEVLRHLMQAALNGESSPVFVGMKIIVPAGRDSPIPPQKIRGDSTEPEIEVHRVGDRVILLTEMPGVSSEHIQVMFQDDRVFIWAREGDLHYQGSARVPAAQKGSEEISFRHGVLEVSYLPLEGEEQKEPPATG